MKQHQVILSLGSNQGNRLENIERCIAQIQQEIGTVIRVSKLYETPAWGFESEKFYNCALVMHSSKSANQILGRSFSIRTQIRKNPVGNRRLSIARIIDIDVIAFDEEIIDNEKLKVPHPEMQNRLFVLVPMRDLNLDWRHPILQKYLHESCSCFRKIKANCKLVQSLDFPLQRMALRPL
jgi:deoxyguanosine kinase